MCVVILDSLEAGSKNVQVAEIRTGRQGGKDRQEEITACHRILCGTFGTEVCFGS